MHIFFYRYHVENPVLCDDNLPELVAVMEMQQARLLGIAHCIVPQQLVDSSVMMEPPMILQKMMKSQPIAVAPNLLQPLQPPPTIVQIIVPSSYAATAVVQTNTTTEEPNNETIIDEHQNDTIPEIIESSSSILMSTTAIPVETIDKQQIQLQQQLQEQQQQQQQEEAEQEQEENSNESEQNETHVVPDDEIDEETEIGNETAQEAVVEELKLSSTTTGPPDVIGNIIHEVFSPIPEVLSPIGAQALSAEPEEPPEVLQDTPEDIEP